MDYTVLKAVCSELSTTWTPAKMEKIVQPDRFTLLIAIRTLEESGWLRLCWNPACAHVSVGDPPGGAPSIAEAFSFGEQLRHLLKGLAIIEVRIPQELERVIELRLGARPSDPPSKHLFVEIMGRYSNVFLTNADMGVLACAYQVGSKMTSVRMVQVGGTYRMPPAAQGSFPSISMGMAEWKLITRATQEDKLQNSLIQAFRGVGPGLAVELISRSGLSPSMDPAAMTEDEWFSLHVVWLDWLRVLEESTFKPGLVRSTGSYSVLGGDGPYILSTDQDSEDAATGILAMLDDYYTRVYETEKFQQLRQQLVAKVSAATKKAQSKVNLFEDQIKASMEYSKISKMADLLMANLHVCEPGALSITLPDFETEEPTTIALDPRQTALVTAQKLYKRSQKLKKSEKAVAPLLAEARDELTYLSQVEVSLQQLDRYTRSTDLRSLEEVRDELVEGAYLKPIIAGTPPPSSKRKKKSSPLDNFAANMRRFTSPSGYEVLVGRNNRQNDVLANRVATEYDLWFHARNIPGSHTVLRVPPGQTATDEDLQFSADLAAYFSKARGSGKVPVSYTSPKYLQKLKGGKPGMVKVEKETVLLGRASDSPEGRQLLATA
ncbi:uncharacterized protein [Physcomitrium patens]|nr:uncharacterized protein LOC112277009 isoform X2 [Physcomitrium patens]|eukprot:XP_024364702.1 uncharacterized protein LOC112277009 isoform X2 [Physcomitrella patens]